MGLFGTQRNAPARLGCFGKLPTYGDFLSLNADGAEAQVLTAWMQDGVGALPASSVVADEQFLTFVWRPEGGRRTLAGVLWPSADAAGRRFPFVVFAAFPTAQFAAHGVHRLLAAEPLWRMIHDVRRRVAALGRDREQRALIDITAVAVPETREIRQAFAQRARAQVLPRDDGLPFGVHLQELAQYASALRAATQVRDFALRMCIHGEADPDAEATAWLRVLSGRLGVEDLDAGLFLRFTRAAGRALYVFHRSLEPADLTFLLAPGESYRFGDSVGFRGVAAGAPDPRALESFQRAWTRGAPTLAGLLDLAGHPLGGPLDVAGPDAGVSPAPPAAAPATGEPTFPRGEPEPAAPPAWAGPPTQDVPRTDPSTVLPVGWPRDPCADETTGNVRNLADARSPSAPADDADREWATAEIPTPTPPAPPAPPDPPAPSAPPPAPATPAASDSSITDDVPAGVSAESVIEARVRELAAGSLLPGRIVRARAPASSPPPGAEAATPTVLVYLDDTGTPSVLSGLDEETVQRIERHVADCAEAQSLLDDLRRLHRAAEERLALLVDEACARTPAPGAA